MYLLNYADAKSIVEKYNSEKFYFSSHKIDSYNIITCNYFLCDFTDFDLPLPEKPEVKAFDMRGVTFIFDSDGSLWKTFYMLPKFFNINQVESTKYERIKDKMIISVSEKEDGSLIAFMGLPNGEIFSKTIGGFTNDQSIESLSIVEKTPYFKEWIKSITDKGDTPLFEYVSPSNRIVLEYKKTELRFIGIRTAEIGFIPASLISKFSIPEFVHVISNQNFEIDELLEKAKVEEKKEGWVLQFEDGQLLKIKTKWYYTFHFLITENIFREDHIIYYYINEKIDEIISQLNPRIDKYLIDQINKTTKSIDNFRSHINYLIHCQ